MLILAYRVSINKQKNLLISKIKYSYFLIDIILNLQIDQSNV